MNCLRSTLAVLLTVFFFGETCLFAQIIQDGDTLYGNEWIDYDQQYYKLTVGEDGLYSISYADLINAGFPVADVNPEELRLYWMGKEQNIHISSAGSLAEGDVILFYGQKNRSQLDRFLFSDPDKMMLNPMYGLTSDTSAYYLTWTPNQTSPYRYQSIDTPDASAESRPDYMHLERLVFSQNHHKGKLPLVDVRFSTYGEGEGFGSSLSHEHSYEISSDFVATGLATCRFRLTGNKTPHNVQISWNGTPKMDLQFRDLADGNSTTVDTFFTLREGELEANNLFTATTSGGSDKVLFSIIELSYPRRFVFHDNYQELSLDDTRLGASILVDSDQEGLLMYDLSGSHIIKGVSTDEGILFNLPAGPDNRKIVLATSGSAEGIAKLEKLDLEDLNSSSADYIIVTSKKLFGDFSNNILQDYVQYRQSDIGGNHTVQVVGVQQLTDQFAYGVDLHPLSIKNFCNFISKYWENSTYIFFIGKGIEYNQARVEKRGYEFIPVYGIPGSDNLLTSRHESSVPLLATGHVSVRQVESLTVYLDKIRTMDKIFAEAPQTLEDRGWMKRVLHLSAGSGATEQNIILNKMNNMARLVQDGPFGGIVHTVKKESSDVIEGTINENTLRLINDGVLIKSYFGHGSVTNTQFQGFEDPFFLDNKDRYPIMFALGCLTGNIFVSDESLGETNVLAKDKGGIAYLATSGLGYLTALDQFALELYDLLLDKLRGRQLGLSVQRTLEKYDANNSQQIKTLAQQFTLHGDPAITLPNLIFPDFVLQPDSVKTIPANITSDLEKFQLSFDVLNLGASNYDSITITVTQRTPSGQIIEHNPGTKIISGYSTNVTLDIPVPSSVEIGNHSFDIILDADNRVEERPDPFAEENNTLSTVASPFNVFISTSSVRTMFPSLYSIVSDPSPTLRAFVTSAEKADRALDFTIDTTPDYSSPMVLSGSIVSDSKIPFWNPPAELQHDQVYFWRVRLAANDTVPASAWHQSSFTYLQDSPQGWSQGHIDQIKTNDLYQVHVDTASNQFSFGEIVQDFTLKNKLLDASDAPRGVVSGNQWSDFFRFQETQSLTVILTDPINEYGFTFNRAPGQYGSHATKQIAAFPFALDSAEARKNVIDFLENQIPAGRLAIVYTTQSTSKDDLNINEWASDSLLYSGKNIFNVLEARGATMVRSLQSEPRPYIFAFRQGIGPEEELIAATINDVISASFFIPTRFSEGSITSTVIGPSTKWLRVELDAEEEPHDSVSLHVIGINTSGEEEGLLSISGTHLVEDLSFIDANIYSKLRIRLSFKDVTNKDLPTLDYFRVLFEKPPEFVPEFVSDKPFHTLHEGDGTIELNYQIFNIGPTPGDSVFYETTVNNLKITKSVPAIPPGNSTSINEFFEFDKAHGSVTVFINPLEKQPEQLAYNNFINDQFSGLVDEEQPILDVLFDDKRILQNEIVSPTPEIAINLRDENPFYFIEDPEQFQIFIIDPNGQRTRYDIQNPVVQFTPATVKNKVAQFILNPTFTQDGTYTLVVQGSDNAGNASSMSDLAIDFEVILESSISQVINYPNPFVNSTKFSYVLTGSEIPQNYRIQIFNPSGIVVRELTEIELGPLQVGKNITQGAWDGTDAYGDKLANGVYLYRFAIDQPLDFEHFHSSIDNFTDKNFGKMVILR